MSDKNKDLGKEFEEEFEFEVEDDLSDDEDNLSELDDEDDELAPDNVAPAGAMPAQKPPIVPILIGLIVTGILSWQLFKWLFQSQPDALDGSQIKPTTQQTENLPDAKTQELPATPAAKSTENSEQQAQFNEIDAQSQEIDSPVQNQAPLPEEDWFQSSSANPSPKPKVDTDALVKKMETQEKNNTEQMKAFNESLTIIINNMNKLDKQMGEVSDDVAMVAEDLQSATQEIKKLKKRPKAEESTNTEIEKQQAEQALSKALIANPLYAVHAIIPGRAWLKNKEGKTLTVTEGDALDKYGKILVIDAPTGVVVTSSGVILRQ